MTDPERQQAVLAMVAAQLEDQRAEQAIKRYLVADGRLSTATVHKAFHGHNLKLSTLVILADALGCDVSVTLIKRPA